MNLKILKDCFYNNELVHKKGETKFVDNSLGMAQRWLNRGMAEVVTEIQEPAKEEVQELSEQVENLVEQVEELVEDVQELVEDAKEEIAKKSHKGKNKVSSKA